MDAIADLNVHIVAAVQFMPVARDVRKNIAIASQLAFEAGTKGARIIVLPELSMSGRNLRSSREAADCAQAVGGYQSESLGEIAQRFKCVIVHGYVEAHRGLFYSSAAIIGPSGAVVGNVRKRSLWGQDHIWAASGDDIAPMPVIVTQFGRIGVLLGDDVRNASSRDGQLYRMGSLDITCAMTDVVLEHGWPDGEWMKLAGSIRSNVIVVNSPGRNRGGSCIIDRKLKPWTHGTSFSETAVVGGMVLM
jgi:hypothetical protein